MNSAPLVTVLGMHRSGTSALAGLLTRLGLHAGAARELLPAAADNPRGFFERADVVDLNDRLLRTRAMQVLGERLRAEGCDTAALLDGFGWLLGAFAPGDGATDDTQHANDIGACLEALAAGAGSAPGLVLKDPRLSLTFPAWHRQAAHSVVLIGLRTPAAVIDSLARRDHIPTALGAFLWTRYTHAAIEASEGLPRLLVDYDRLLADPGAAIDTLVTFLGANGVGVDTARRGEALAFLSPELRHSHGAGAAQSNALYRRLLDGLPETGPSLPTDETPGERELAFYQALRVILSQRLADERAQAEHLARVLERLERHVVSGGVIRILRRLKRDPGFGAP